MQANAAPLFVAAQTSGTECGASQTRGIRDHRHRLRNLHTAVVAPVGGLVNDAIWPRCATAGMCGIIIGQTKKRHTVQAEFDGCEG
ncbi:hypothetical protein DC363_06120 [Thalassorhabdomicrobium marinisediminis]|uniref:Uncharacterized protein n=1 Tax=Thalassorhabdomicrobium marinisediminis TaxID=2170577 RepID=A0A2T7FZ29_9RHOB|nr:hypothetical protein DC363_06120 [Thalassorhabdomicrobium marinisediminis]